MRIFYSFSVLRGLAMGIFSPIWIIYLVHQGYSLLEIGLLGALFEIAKFIFEVPSGTFADRFGIKVSIVGSFLFSILTWGFFPFIESLIVCIAALVAWALSDSLISGAYETWMSRVAGEEQFGKEIMKNTQLMILTIILGSISSGYLYTVNPYLPFVLVVTVYLVLFVWMLLFVSVPKIDLEQENTSFVHILKSSLKIMMNQRRVFLIVIAGFFTALVYDTISRYWQPYMGEIGVSEKTLGYIFAVAGAISFLLLMLTIRLEKKIEKSPYKALTIVDGLGMVLSIIIATGFRSVGLASVAMVLAMEDIRHPIETSYLNKFFPDSYKTTLFSLNAGVGALGEISSGIIFGLIAAQFGLAITFVAAGLCIAPALIIYSIVPRLKEKTQKDTPAVKTAN
ncbi:MFS transporter [Halobacillus trueperi]|uniref:MFS transporter n=1 Tax=Halobacillus trueperi TaxID=156205 RepID=A0A3E0J4Y0_9BACI|nr:MFS transporter [Halobacillus trueperi]REJ07940.1 MFS transporter [Halobacillus trueperi]